MALQHPFLTTTVKQHIIDLSRRGDIKQAKDYLAKTLRVKKSQKNDWYRKIMIEAGLPVGTVGQQKQFEGGDSDIPSSSMSAKATYAGDTGVAESVTKDIRSLDDLIKACNIDLEVWEVERYVVNKWAVAMREPATTVGGRGKDAEVHINEKGGRSTLWTRGSHIPVREPLFQVKAWLRRKKTESDLKALLAKFTDEAMKHAPKRFEYTPPVVKDGRLLEISASDCHFAKLCWGVETRGPDYDLKIAVSDYKKAVYGLAAHAKANGVSRILLPIGNDILNSDNLNGTTTAGTPQATSEDGRWQKAYSTVCAVVTEVIETLASDFYVDIVIVSGNHDKERCYYLGEYLRAWFRNHKQVTVDNAPAQRKFYTFGTVLLMFTHGNEEKKADLPLLLATEAKEAWSKTKIREIHVGHEHQERVTEKMGVKTRVISAMVPQDEWATSKGYVGNIRLAEAFLYDSEDGLLANYYHNV
jgi:predicted phosphodiesterase